MRRAAATLLLTAAWGALSAAAPAAEVRVTADPGLTPRFQRSVTDYVSRCAPGEPLTLSVRASDGDRVAVAGKPARGGEFVRTVHRGTGARVSLTVDPKTGPKRRHHVRCLPEDFPRWVTSRRGKPQAQWYVLTPNGDRRKGFAAIFDSHGVPLWWMRSDGYGPWDAKLLPGRHIAWTKYLGDRFGVRPEHAYEEFRLDGRFVREIRAADNPTDTHDLQRMPNGHYLVLAYRKRHGVDLRAFGGPEDGTVWDGEIQELRPDGELVWSWNSKDHFSPAETKRWWPGMIEDQGHHPPAERAYDLVHLNSVEPDGDGFVVSARHIDAVFRIDKKTGAVEWKLGGTKRAESLKVNDDPLGKLPLAGQHEARLLPDGSLTVFDNGTNAHRPRAVRFRIRPNKGTATLLEAVGHEDVPASGFAGGTQKLRGGNWVTYWGGSGLTTEQRPSGKTVLGIFVRDEMWGYRAVAIPRGRLGARTLRKAMDRMVGLGPAAWR